MKLSKLLSQRHTLLQQARLANLAFAYDKLAEFNARVVRGNLRGVVTVRHPQPEAERYTASLVAHEGNPSVLEEHFTDEDALDLADVLAFLTGAQAVSLSFRLEEIPEKFLRPLRQELEKIGVEVDGSLPEDTLGEAPLSGSDYPQADESG